MAGSGALAGIAFSAPQPPGSTFKIVTSSTAFSSGKYNPDSRYYAPTARFGTPGVAVSIGPLAELGQASGPVCLPVCSPPRRCASSRRPAASCSTRRTSPRSARVR